MLAIQNFGYKAPALPQTSVPVVEASVPEAKFKESSLNLEKIQEVFLKNFEKEFASYKNTMTKQTTEANLIRNCEVSFVRNRKFEHKNKEEYTVNFAININNGDLAQHRKKYGKEIGMFNFKYTVYQPVESGSEFRMSYFSEVGIEEAFQGYGLFNPIIKAYKNTLADLDTDIDYLHVKSQMPFTASVYKKQEYNFTAATEEYLNSNWESVAEYLKDSSVTYSESEKIEMFRSLKETVEVRTSIVDLEKDLDTRA